MTRTERRASRKYDGPQYRVKLTVGEYITHSKNQRGEMETRIRSAAALERTRKQWPGLFFPLATPKAQTYASTYAPQRPTLRKDLHGHITRDNCPCCGAHKRGGYKLTADGVRRLYKKRADKLKNL